MKHTTAFRSGSTSRSIPPQTAKRHAMNAPSGRLSRKCAVSSVGSEIDAVTAPPLGAVKSVYLDFDDTISEGLSTRLQVKAVYDNVAKGMDSVEEAERFLQERKALIGKFSVEYEAAIKQNLLSIFAQFPPGEFNMDSIDSAMAITAEFDRHWQEIGVQNRVYAGVRKEDFLRVAPMTPVKENALEVIHAMQEAGIEVAVASINWSAEWIQKVIGDRSFVASSKSTHLCHHLSPQQLSSGVSVPEGRIKIYSNEMIYEDGKSTGTLSTLMESGQDKSAVIKKLLKEAKESNGSSVGKSVFIGDSFNDIQPLLMVDVGIVMGENKALLMFAKHFGIELAPLSSANLTSEKPSSDTPVLYLTNSWNEVAEAILGKEKAAQYLTAVPQ